MKGKLLKAAKKLEKIVSDLDALEFEFQRCAPSATHPSIDIGHALEGVRTNGTQRRSCVLDAYKGIRAYEDSAAELIREANIAYKTVRGLAASAEGVLFTDFSVCEACDGAQGVGDSGLMTWVDCAECDGRGIVPK